MRFAVILLGLAACTTQPSEPIGIHGGDLPPPSCASDPLPARSTIEVLGGSPMWVGDSILVTAGWSKTCHGLVACFGDDEDDAIYSDCSTAPVEAHVTTTGAAATVTDTGLHTDSTVGEGWYASYTIAPTAAGSLAVHIAMTNTTTNEMQSKDATWQVWKLDDIRLRCLVGPAFDTPCPDTVPAGTEIGVAIDGHAGDGFHPVATTVTFSGIALQQAQSCTQRMIGTDAYASTFCLVDGATQPFTVTASAFDVTRNVTLSVQ